MLNMKFVQNVKDLLKSDYEKSIHVDRYYAGLHWKSEEEKSRWPDAYEIIKFGAKTGLLCSSCSK